MALIFNERKATQAAARFLRLNGGTMNYMVLIKSLYLLDRAALLNWGRLATCDDIFEMKLGPVLSQVHDLITEMQPEETYWTQHISRQRFDVSLVRDPGNGELSEAEEEAIDDIFATFGHVGNPFVLAEELHRILPELKGISRGRIEITPGDILRAEKRSAEEISAIEREIESLGHVQSLYAAR